MACYGAALVPDERTELAVEERVKPASRSSFSARRGHRRRSSSWARHRPDQLRLSPWIPTNLRRLGYTDVTADRILRDPELIGFPLNFLIAALYGLWSTKTIVLAALAFAPKRAHAASEAITAQEFESATAAETRMRRPQVGPAR